MLQPTNPPESNARIARVVDFNSRLETVRYALPILGRALYRSGVDRAQQPKTVSDLIMHGAAMVDSDFRAMQQRPAADRVAGRLIERITEVNQLHDAPRAIVPFPLYLGEVLEVEEISVRKPEYHEVSEALPLATRLVLELQGINQKHRSALAKGGEGLYFASDGSTQAFRNDLLRNATVLHENLNR